MANTLTTQIIADGPRNAVVQIEGNQNTSDLAYTTVINPASGFVGMDNTGLILPADFRVMRLQYSIEDVFTVDVWWDATTPVLLATLNGRGEIKWDRFGGMPNYGGAGRTGKIGLSTQGWASGALSFTLVFEMIKQGTL